MTAEENNERQVETGAWNWVCFTPRSGGIVPFLKVGRGQNGTFLGYKLMLPIRQRFGGGWCGGDHLAPIDFDVSEIDGEIIVTTNDTREEIYNKVTLRTLVEDATPYIVSDFESFGRSV